MKSLEYHRPSVLAFFIIITGVVALVPANETSALTRNTNQSVKTSVFESPLKESEIKIEGLKDTLEVKEDQIDDKEKNVEAVKTEAEKAEQEKERLAQEVAQAKAEVESLKRQVEEKKRREAEIAAAKAPVVINGFVAGNGYVPGQCTWYVKNKRPDIGNFWGNADRWYYSAQAEGFLTGNRPRPGAIAQAVGEMHVAYVESVDGDMVTVSEMNYGGPWIMNTRTVHYSQFIYIYNRA